MRICEFAGLQRRNRTLRFFARLGRQDVIGHVEINGGGVAIQHNVDLSRVQGAHHLHFFLRAEIASGTHFNGVVSVRNVGENALRGIFGRLPGVRLICGVYQPEQRLTVEMRSGVFGEHREDEHAGAGAVRYAVGESSRGPVSSRWPARCAHAAVASNQQSTDNVPTRHAKALA